MGQLVKSYGSTSEGEDDGDDAPDHGACASNMKKCRTVKFMCHKPQSFCVYVPCHKVFYVPHQKVFQ